MTDIVNPARFVVHNAHEQAAYPLTGEHLLKIVAMSSDGYFAEVEDGMSIEHDHRGFHFDEEGNACAEVRATYGYRDRNGVPHVNESSLVGYVRL